MGGSFFLLYPLTLVNGILSSFFNHFSADEVNTRQD